MLLVGGDNAGFVLREGRRERVPGKGMKVHPTELNTSRYVQLCQCQVLTLGVWAGGLK